MTIDPVLSVHVFCHPSQFRYMKLWWTPLVVFTMCLSVWLLSLSVYVSVCLFVCYYLCECQGPTFLIV